MDIDMVREALAEPTQILRADGADLELIDVDDALDRVTLRLRVDGANCAECILPPDQLHEMISTTVQRVLRNEVEVVVHDPRRSESNTETDEETAS